MAENITGQDVALNASTNSSNVLSASNNATATIFFTNSSDFIEQRIYVNGRDYSGVKQVITGSGANGTIQVDGAPVSVKGWAELNNTILSLAARVAALEGNGGNSGTGEGGDNYGAIGNLDVIGNVWYVGQIDRNRTEFAALASSDLVYNARAYSTDTTSSERTGLTKNCWYVMVPNGYTVNGAHYINSEQQTINYSGEQVRSTNFQGQMSHEDVIINNVVYKVYVQRSTAFVDSNMPSWFDIIRV